MIFGSTHAQRKRRKQLDEIKKIYGAKKFAWFPIQLASGRYAWLVTYYEYSAWDCIWLHDSNWSVIKDAWAVPHPAPQRYLDRSADYVHCSHQGSAEQLAEWVQTVKRSGFKW